MSNTLPLISLPEIQFTIFTPTYNRSNTLHRVYESIKKQSLQKINNTYIFEWIIVDDGSTDSTRELVELWKKTSEFEIIYIFQENSGKVSAMQKGIEAAKGELFLIIDSDDAFLPETFETFYIVWKDFTIDQKKQCGGIGVLCQDQFGHRIGNNYPVEKHFLPTIQSYFGWRSKSLGETWSILNTITLKKYFTIPNEAANLKFIPESFFWSKMAIEAHDYSYYLNKVLRIYYINEGGNISENIRKKHPDGFLFESRWFVKNYWWILFKYPKVFLKHLLKYAYFFTLIFYKNFPKKTEI
ncbi:MAG TPA: glycosyltransferase family 2 protein [Sulfuricurvum sp.]|nr:glycosyltransferase family 2 protein [Sulfuricurvum sp.]